MAPARAQAVFSDTAAPPPPVRGAPAGTGALVGAAAAPPVVVPPVVVPPVVVPPVVAVDFGEALGVGVAVVLAEDVAGGSVTATVPAPPVPVDALDLGVGLVELKPGAPTGMRVVPLGVLASAEADALAVGFAEAVFVGAAVEAAADGLAVDGGSVTATVVPPPAAPALVDALVVGAADVTAAPPPPLVAAGLADGLAVAPGSPTATVLPAEAGLGLPVDGAVGLGVSVVAAAGADDAVDEVSFCDHSPISESTPARTAIAMIAPTTHEVLFGASSPDADCSPGSLFGLAILAPVVTALGQNATGKKVKPSSNSCPGLCKWEGTQGVVDHRTSKRRFSGKLAAPPPGPAGFTGSHLPAE